jgi:hypothetical protein
MTNDRVAGGTGAILLTRVAISNADWDRWQVHTHMADLVAGPGVEAASLYEVVAVGQGTGTDGVPTRTVIYFAPDLGALRAWLASDELTAAIRDGSQWSSYVSELDGAWFTGNVYESRGATGSNAGPLWRAMRLVVARWEGAADEGDEHLRDVAERASGFDGVSGALALAAIRDRTVRDLYHSVGDRAVLLTVEDGFGPSDLPRVVALVTARAATEARAYTAVELVRLMEAVEAPGGDA